MTEDQINARLEEIDRRVAVISAETATLSTHVAQLKRERPTPAARPSRAHRRAMERNDAKLAGVTSRSTALAREIEAIQAEIVQLGLLLAAIEPSARGARA